MNGSGDFNGGDFDWWRDFSRGGAFSSGDFHWWRGECNSTHVYPSNDILHVNEIAPLEAVIQML